MSKVVVDGKIGSQFYVGLCFLLPARQPRRVGLICEIPNLHNERQRFGWILTLDNPTEKANNADLL